MDETPENMVKQNTKVVPFPDLKEKSSDGFKGQFKNLKLSDLIQLGAQGKMSLILYINQKGKEGKIYMRNGEIVHASYGKKTGVEAFYEIMSWKNGDFRSEDYIPPPIQSISLPWEHLLIEAHRWMDEKEAKRSQPSKSEALSLEDIPEKTLNGFREWGSSHPDIGSILLFSSAGVREIFSKEHQQTFNNSFEILHAIPDTAQALSDTLGYPTCHEVVIRGSEGTILIICLQGDLQLFVHVKTDIF